MEGIVVVYLMKTKGGGIRAQLVSARSRMAGGKDERIVENEGNSAETSRFTASSRVFSITIFISIARLCPIIVSQSLAPITKRPNQRKPVRPATVQSKPSRPRFHLRPSNSICTLKPWLSLSVRYLGYLLPRACHQTPKVYPPHRQS